LWRQRNNCLKRTGKLLGGGEKEAWLHADRSYESALLDGRESSFSSRLAAVKHDDLEAEALSSSLFSLSHTLSRAGCWFTAQ